MLLVGWITFFLLMPVWWVGLGKVKLTHQYNVGPSLSRTAIVLMMIMSVPTMT